MLCTHTHTDMREGGREREIMRKKERERERERERDHLTQAASLTLDLHQSEDVALTDGTCV